jgi:multidrug efflux pump subunit AcrA (membrane-fusion protein)
MCVGKEISAQSFHLDCIPKTLGNDVALRMCILGLMTERPTASPERSVDALRVQMERSIDDLAEMSRTAVEPGRFFAEVLKRTLQPGGATRGVLWRQSNEGLWEPAGIMPATDTLDAGSVEFRQELLGEMAIESQPRVMSSGSDALANGTPSKATLVFSPLRHADQTVGILETVHAVDGSGRLPPTTFQFFAALCEIAADFLSQQELQQLRRAQSTWVQWDQYGQRLGQSLDLAMVGSVIANDGRVLIGCDRISVLVRRGRGYRLVSVSGVDRVDPRAGSARSLESLARLVARRGRAVWQSLTPSDGSLDSAEDREFTDALRRHAHDAGTSCLGLIPLASPVPPASTSGDATNSLPEAVIAFEQFHANDAWLEWQSRGTMLVQRSAFALRAAIERDSIPWLGLWQTMQSGPRFLRRPAIVVVAAMALVIVGALIVIPAEFTVTGPAELWPERRRDVFAGTSGIVDQILVEHGTNVEADQPLLVLRDPELEQEAPKVLGEIATVTERLKSVQAARLSGGNLPDATGRARQLTADEEELKERLKTLELHRALIEERQKARTLRSPIAGQVLTWDVAQHLSARPVDRGQALITIGASSGPWIVQIRVPDTEVGPVRRARQKLKPDLDVEFLLASDPGKTYRGRVRDVALSTESDDRSTGFVRVIVEFDRGQIDHLRPGATAIPRIHCGRKPLGYVWLHDLIDAVRTRLLF